MRTVTGMAGRSELHQQRTQLHAALAEALRAGAQHVHGEELSELRALLTELSHNRARQGFTPGETTLSDGPRLRSFPGPGPGPRYRRNEVPGPQIWLPGPVAGLGRRAAFSAGRGSGHRSAASVRTDCS
ncbi:RsbRD N-terminal domain-containing protein [Streptomyces uncialis]|uniref:RsbRD N-terminal domain-containing protein n=1 Tax=Streptomyces uncialis TaxID=1048205 RepID=UPI0037934414